jgi:hydroxymethylpyrimidine/phosphomethylpyrimidine kinase
VLDPILHAGGGSKLVDQQLMEFIVEKLFPLTTVLTPNTLEAREITHLEDIEDCAQALLKTGCEYLLITGSHENSEKVCNRLYSEQQLLESFLWERLPGSYHGSGCTLSVAIAGLLAQELDPVAAVYEAQQYTWESLKHAYRVGKGQLIPNRLFWAQDGDAI